MHKNSFEMLKIICALYNPIRLHFKGEMGSITIVKTDLGDWVLKKC